MVNVDEEVQLLVQTIQRLGSPDAQTGKHAVSYGVLFRDDGVANQFEALLGTLKAAKKRQLLTFEGELLLQGVHDHVVIKLM
jgi:hypothetical protein